MEDILEVSFVFAFGCEELCISWIREPLRIVGSIATGIRFDSLVPVIGYG